MNITYFHPRGRELVGFIPYFLSDDDPRSAAEQFMESYAHGGGWRPMDGWTLEEGGGISYPEDPTLYPVARIRFRDETLYVYQYAWVAIVQPDGSFEVARMD